MAVEQGEAQEASKLAESIKGECEEALEKAIPELESAIKALKTLKKSEIDEVKVMQHPPPGVRITLEAIAITNGQKATKVADKANKGKFIWDFYETGKKMLYDTKFIRKLATFNRDSLTDEIMGKLQPYTDNEKFRPGIR